jgi:hypothetical protein
MRYIVEVDVEDDLSPSSQHGTLTDAVEEMVEIEQHVTAARVVGPVPKTPIVVLAGDPSNGFQVFGPTEANTPEVEALTAELHRTSCWWYADLLPVTSPE